MDRNQLARQLLLSEAGADRTAGAIARAAQQASAKIRLPFVRILGQHGSDAVFGRAIHLVAADYPLLRGVEASREGNGSFDWLWRAVGEGDSEDALGSAAAIIAAFIDLLCAFIGEGLTHQQLRAVWPELSMEGATT